MFNINCKKNVKHLAHQRRYYPKYLYLAGAFDIN